MEHSIALGAEATEAEVVKSAVSDQITWRDFVNLTKPGIVISNLITTFGGFWLAAQWHVDWLGLFYVLIGTGLVMGSACALNNYWDRDMDTKMERTKTRALPAGKIQPIAVLWFGIAIGVLGTGILYFLNNPLTALLGLLGWFVYVCVYTAWFKRTSVWSTVVGSVSGAMPPVMGYCAVTGQIDMNAAILFAILFLWQPPHFWALGIRRTEEYRAAGFPLLPVVLGSYVTKLSMVRYVVLLVPVSLLLYVNGSVGVFYLISATILGVVWAFMCVSGFRAKAEKLWAKKVFLYSINYLTVLFVIMVLDTVRGS